MRLLVDTTDLDEIREVASWGVCQGVTTNPSLIAKSGRDFKEVADAIFEILPDGDISLEVVATTADEMVAEGLTLLKWQPRAIIKLPMGAEGLKACHRLSAMGHRVNVTLIFSPSQALLAARAGAYYVSVFIGRHDDAGMRGMTVVEETARIFKHDPSIKSQILAASIRHPEHLLSCALAGAHAGTMPFKVLKQATQHPMTDIGLASFLRDWEKADAAKKTALR
jgi:transaldolase